MSDQYKDSQRAIDYKNAYDEWMRGKTPAERAKLVAKGVGSPDTDAQQINGKAKSVEDLSFLSVQEPEEREESSRVDALVAVFSRVRSSGNPLLYIDALLSALRVTSIESMTCAELAHRHGVSKQRFDIMRNAIIDAFDLPPAPGGRTKGDRCRQAARVRVSKPWVKYTTPLDSWRRWWNNTMIERPLDEWSDDERRIIKSELKWFVDVYMMLDDYMGDDD